MRTYTTLQGDAWDLIAYRIYGDESYMKYLIEANWDYADVLVFPSGIALAIPDLPEEAEEGAPFWREDGANADYDAYEE
jgi:phage tail protein X